MRPLALAFVNLKGNVGDLAILEAMLRDLAARRPGRPVELYPHPFLPVDAARVAAFRAASGFDATPTGRTFAAAIPAPLRVLRRLGAERAVQAWQVGRLASRADAGRFAGHEAVLVAGGDQWNGARLGVSMFGTLHAAARHAPVAAYPFSVNPAVRRFNRDADLRRHFGRLRAPLLVRDTTSLGVLQGIGVPATLAPDCAWTLEPIARAVPPRADRNPARVLLCLTGTPAMDAYAANRAALDALGGRAELMTTCAAEDGPALRRLGRERGVPVHEPLTWQDAAAELAASSVAVANRLHALILGAMAGAVMVPVADRPKSEAFARDAGLTHVAPSPGAVTAGLAARARAAAAEVQARLGAFAAAARDGAISPLDRP